MIKVDRQSIGVEPPARVYINKISLSRGSSTNIRGEKKVYVNSKFPTAKNQEGDLSYLPKNNGKNLTDEDAPLGIYLEMYLHDIITQKRRNTWMLSPLITDRCSVLIIASTNKDLTDRLVGNGFNLDVLGDYTNHIDYERISFGLASETNDRTRVMTTAHSDGSRVLTMIKEVSIALSTTPKHLTLFCTLDVPTLDTGKSQGSNVRGAVSIERIISRSSLVSKTFLLKKNAQTIWAGPAHYHEPTGWMEGYTHTSSPHAPLLNDIIENFKIVDRRILNEIRALKINPISVTPKQSHNYISNLYLSRTSEGEAAGIFTIDYLKILSGLSAYGNFISTASPSVQKEIMAHSSIDSLKISRERVQEKQGSSKIQSAKTIVDSFNKKPATTPIIESREKNGTFQSLDKYSVPDYYKNQFVEKAKGQKRPSDQTFYSKVEEINVDPTLRTRSFTVNDSLLGITDGTYQYTLEIRVKDGTHKFIENTIKQLDEVLHGLQNYLNTSMLPVNYDAQDDKFKMQFIKNQLDEREYLIPSTPTAQGVRSIITNPRDTRRVQIWVGAITKYIEILDILTEVTPQQKRRLVRALYTMISPASGTPAGTQDLIQLIDSLKAQASSLLRTKKAGHAKEKSSASQGSKKTQVISLSHKFSETFDANVLKKTGFDYFGIKNGAGILKIRHSDISAAIKNQLDNLGSNSYTVQELSTAFNSLSAAEAQAFYSTKEDVSYIAPTAMELSGREVSLWSKDSLDYVSLTAVAQNLNTISRGKMVDVEPSQKVLDTLNEFGKGTSEARLNKLNDLYVENAVATGIMIRGSKQATAAPPTKSSTAALGKDNKFSSEDVPVAELTTPKIAPPPKNAIAVLNTILSKTGTSAKASIQAPAPKDISFNLDKQNNVVARALKPNSKFTSESEREKVTIRNIQDLPPQAKALARSKGNVYSDPGGLLSATDDAQSDAFTYNVGMVRVIEYLSGYEGGSVKRPMWKKLTQAELQGPYSAFRVCRIRKYTNAAVNIGIYDSMEHIPVYNEYFLLSGPRVRAVTKNSPAKSGRLSKGGESFSKGNFGRGAEREIFSQLLTLESQQKMLDYHMEYTVTEAPLAPLEDNRTPTEETPAPAAEDTMVVPAAAAKATTESRSSPQPTSTPSKSYAGGY